MVIKITKKGLFNSITNFKILVNYEQPFRCMVTKLHIKISIYQYNKLTYTRPRDKLDILPLQITNSTHQQYCKYV